MKLHVEEDGPPDGAPVVFLHGVSGSSRTYAWLPEEITAGRRILRPDFRGHGRSEHAPGSYVVERYADDIVELLRDRVGRPAMLVGHSLGGCVAWEIAQRHPELVAGAFLEDPPLYRGEPEGHEANTAIPAFRVLILLAARWHRNGVGAEEAAATLAAAPFGPDPSHRAGDILTEDALAARAESLLAMDPGVLEQATDRSTLAGIDTRSPITVPMAMIVADDALGAAFTTPHADRLARSHPEVRVVRVTGAGHGIHQERASRPIYVRELAAFLAEHAPR